ncbi:MAG: UPF0182 family protein [Thermoleophilia bacterium]
MTDASSTATPPESTPRTESHDQPEDPGTGGTKRSRILKLRPGPLRRAVIIAIILVLVFGVGGLLSLLWTEILWYREVGYTSVFWTPVWAQTLVGLFFAAIFFVIFYGSLYAAHRISARMRQVRETPESAVFDPAPRRRWPERLMLIASVVAAAVVGIFYAPRWEQVLLFLNRSAFGYNDPIFGKDASFFVFTLPLWKTLVNFVGLAMLFTFIATVLAYVFNRAMVLDVRRRIRPAPYVKTHLSIILAIAMLAKAGDYMIQAWSINLSQNATVFGAGYTDVHARLPVLHFLAVVSLVAAVMFMVNIRYRGWRLPALAVLIMVLSWAIGGKAYPAIIQQYRVTPNEISAEAPYISNNIAATRWAYGLNNMTDVSSKAADNLTAADIQDNSATVDNIRLWEPRPALSTYAQIQEIRLYYSFKDVDVDRYTIDGKYREVLVSARELDQSRLQKQSQTWVNLHLTYTHGYGAVVSPVNEAGADGLPLLFIKDIPPRSSTDLRITRPEIYYGEMGNEFVVVNTTTPEFDYPRGDSSVTTTYQGDGGISIGNRLRRIAFGFRFADAKLFFSNSLTSDSRIMYRRTIEERVRTLAPFLRYDADPYLVIRDDGSLVWMWDAYTTSDHFPYSQPRKDGINYLRNPIKVVINAYDGKITFYQVDAHDPIATAWGGVYDGLFTPGNQMPDDLRRHMRYPEDMYKIQAEVLTIYHMENPQIFYNKEDVWAIPMEIYGKKEIPVVPYYEVLALPGETDPEFALLQPFTPLKKKNLVSLLVARQDGDNYGRLALVTFPKDKLVFGPAQVEARITNDPVISSQLTLWDQAGSEVIRGNLLVVPLEDGVMYFEPLYLQAKQSPIPELTRVIVSYGDKVVMEPTLTDALAKIFGGSIGAGSAATTAPSDVETPGGTTGTTIPTGPTTTLPSEAAELITQANRHYQAAVAAQERGDTAEHTRELQALGTVLEALNALQR